MQTICKHATCLKDANIAVQFLTCSLIRPPLPSHCPFMYYRELHFTYSLVDRLLGGEANGDALVEEIRSPDNSASSNLPCVELPVVAVSSEP